MNNLDIFICTHKPFEQVVSNPCYQVINVKDIDTSDLEYNDDFYSEMVAYFEVIKRNNLKDYVGFCHYRRYFSFLDDVPDMDEIFKECDAILPTPLRLGTSVRKQYAIYHNIEDLNLIESIVNRLYPSFDTKKVLDNNIFFTNNMFVMKSEDFSYFMVFYQIVMQEYLRIVGDIDERIEKNKEKYLKNIPNCPQNGEIWYQKRIGGYLAERLLNIFIFNNFKKIKTYDIKVTENKYKIDKYVKMVRK